MEQIYELTIDWTGSKYLGYTVEFDDIHHTVSLSMPNYVPKLLQRFFPNEIVKGAPSPAVYQPPQYGKSTQRVMPSDPADTLLSPPEVTRLQEIIGSLLFYARAVDYTILSAVGHVASIQATPTRSVMDAAIRIIRYLASYPAHKLVFPPCAFRCFIFNKV